MRQRPRPFDKLRTGFNLHAGVRCAEDDRKCLEQLRRYITRPAIADERLSVDRAGQVVLKLKTAWRDGIGTSVALSLTICAVAMGLYALIALKVVRGYARAWVGHFGFRKTSPRASSNRCIHSWATG